ncbi:MAG: hypothetical protein IPM16_06735 [Chloroflexi bacterium]|nr:hypothetical protein [Chloroflexota bacterium]
MTAPTFEILINWTAAEGFHREARPGDAVNLFPATFPNYEAISGATLFVSRLPHTRTDRMRYGRSDYLQVLTTAGNPNAGVTLGKNGVTYSLGAQAAGTYSGVVWVRHVISSATSMLLRLRSSAGILATTTFTSSAEWQRVAVTGVLGSSLPLYLEVVKNGAAVNLNFDIAGEMIVAGGTAPAGFNNGALTRYDNVTAWAKAATWNCGFRQQYRHVSDVGRASFLLRDDDGIFSPERTDSPLYGSLLPGRFVAVVGADAVLSDDVVMWWGITQGFRPNADVGEVAECRIEAVDLRGMAHGKTIRAPLQIDKTAHQIIWTVNSLLQLPAGELDAGQPLPPSEYWEEVYPYGLDAANKDEADAIRIIADCAGAVQGKFLYNARQFYTNDYTFKFVHDLTTSSIGIALDSSRLQPGTRYQFGESIVNDSTVVARKRKISTATNKVLYDIEEAITLEPNETQVLRARFKDNDLEDDKTVSGTDIYLEYTADAGVTATLTEEYASAADVTIVNGTSAEKTVSALKIRGKKLTSWAETEHRATDATSLDVHGVRAELLDYRLPQNRKLAQRTADYRVGRFGTAFGEITSVTLKTLEGDDDLRAAMLEMGVFDTVSIDVSARNGHSANYTIVGEEHRLDSGLGAWTVTWTVEKIHPFTILDDAVYGELDAGNVLSFY